MAFDLAVINLMGLKYEYLPVLNQIPEIKNYSLWHGEYSRTKIASNDEALNTKMMDDIPIAPYGYFTPAEGWEIISKRQER